MSGHSKWQNIKHRKESVDKKREKIFSKISRLISVAAKKGGADPEMNPELRQAVEKAKELNVPKDNIERAIKKGSGQIEGEQIEEVIYEAYGSNGIAVIIKCITDNRNRTLSEIKHILSNFEGKMAQAGSVSYMFNKKGENWVAKYTTEADQETKAKIEKLFEALDENDDVQEIYSNLKM